MECLCDTVQTSVFVCYSTDFSVLCAAVHPAVFLCKITVICLRATVQAAVIVCYIRGAEFVC